MELLTAAGEIYTKHLSNESQNEIFKARLERLLLTQDECQL